MSDEPKIELSDAVNEDGEVELATLAEFVFGREMADRMILHHSAFSGASDQLPGDSNHAIEYLFSKISQGFDNELDWAPAIEVWNEFVAGEHQTHRLMSICTSKMGISQIRQCISQLGSNIVRLDPDIAQAKRLLIQACRKLEKSEK